MIKEHAYLVMMVPADEITVNELNDYNKMPWVEVEFDDEYKEAAIITKCY